MAEALTLVELIEELQEIARRSPANSTLRCVARPGGKVLGASLTNERDYGVAVTINIGG